MNDFKELRKLAMEMTGVWGIRRLLGERLGVSPPMVILSQFSVF